MHRRRTQSSLTLAMLLAGSLGAGSMAASVELSIYSVSHLPSLGGASSAGIGINNAGRITGFSELEGDEILHATLWVRSQAFDLGSLGGPAANSAVLWPVKSNRRVVVGVSETEEVDPLGEAWSCSFFFPTHGHTCLGFVWQNGVMKPLPAFEDGDGNRGNNSFAAGVNNRGEIVGWAENTVHDDTCEPPQVLQFRAAIWEPKKGRMRELPPYQDDTTSSATAINNRGQVVGISGTCGTAVGGPSAAHAVLWENGKVTDLGNLGLFEWNTPMAINQRGDIVGFAAVPGEEPDSIHLRAFLWTEDGGMEELGTIDEEDVESQALGINARGQVVGLSCTADYASCRAFLWQDGVMTDLNTLTEPGYTGHLVYANDINDAGAITGAALDPETGDVPAFLAIPASTDEGVDSAAARAAESARPKLRLSDAARAELLRGLGLASAAQRR